MFTRLPFLLSFFLSPLSLSFSLFPFLSLSLPFFLDYNPLFYDFPYYTNRYLKQQAVLGRGRGALCSSLHYSPKFYNSVFIFVGLKTLGTFIEFCLACSLVECLNVSTTNCKLRCGDFCIIIGNVHQFIDHCLIPLDPWVLETR